MNKDQPNSSQWIMVWAGDFLVLLAVTVIGFISHNSNFLSLRMFATFIPFCIAWAFVAPWFGLFQPESWNRSSQIWRAAQAAVIATPLATFLRGLWLGSAIQPIFVLVMVAISALAMSIWRTAWVFISRKRMHSHG